MALATKCPHCNTVFRVAHDQLKLRGGIVRCGSCNEVFDGNAALLEPPTPLPVSPLPEPTPFDQKMAALDTRAAEVLTVEEAEPVLELDPKPESDLDSELELEPEPAIDLDNDNEPVDTPPPFPLPAEPAVLPADSEALFDLDLDMESEPGLEADADANAAPHPAPAPVREPALEDVLNVESLSDAELEAALEAELSAMEQTLVTSPNDADGQITADATDAIEAEAARAIESAEAAETEAEAAEAADASYATYEPPQNGRREPTWEEPGTDTTPAAPQAARSLRDDELDEADEEALVQLSSAGRAEAQSPRVHTFLQAFSVEAPPAPQHEPEPAAESEPTPEPVSETEYDQAVEEPGFVRRARQRQKYGKATTIAMSLGSVLLVAALLGQAVTTFRNSLAAAMPPLKPALTAVCNALGCKIELPTQIDDLTIEQGELQTLSDTAFSFTTLLRNQSATAQAWPSIELVLDDDKDKHILRRVFTPRDYLSVDVAQDKGFAPHTEQAVKLYFELHDLKASGYHIAVFYP